MARDVAVRHDQFDPRQQFYVAFQDAHIRSLFLFITIIGTTKGPNDQSALRGAAEQEGGQVPERPENAEDQARPERRKTALQKR
jgi:hypothetical protein